MSEKDQAWLNECHQRAHALATAQGCANPTFTDTMSLYRKVPRQAAQETATSISRHAQQRDRCICGGGGGDDDGGAAEAAPWRATTSATRSA
jgi:hypothetical protein